MLPHELETGILDGISNGKRRGMRIVWAGIDNEDLPIATGVACGHGAAKPVLGWSSGLFYMGRKCSCV